MNEEVFIILIFCFKKYFGFKHSLVEWGTSDKGYAISFAFQTHEQNAKPTLFCLPNS